MSDDKTPEEIARMDAERYREPGRDLLATRPAPEGGDEDNPVADEHSHGESSEDKLGSDENNRLADTRRT